MTEQSKKRSRTRLIDGLLFITFVLTAAYAFTFSREKPKQIEGMDWLYRGKARMVGTPAYQNMACARIRLWLFKKEREAYGNY